MTLTITQLLDLQATVAANPDDLNALEVLREGIKQYETFVYQVRDVRNAQTAYFASRRANRFGSTKLLKLSKDLEGLLDGTVRETLKQEGGEG